MVWKEHEESFTHELASLSPRLINSLKVIFFLRTDDNDVKMSPVVHTDL